VGTRCEDVIEKITSAAGPAQFLVGAFAELDRRPEQAVTLTPQAQVGRGHEGVSGRRVPALLRSVNEVEGRVAGNERHFGDLLHNVSVPAMLVLLVHCSCEVNFAGASIVVLGTTMIAVLLAAVAAIGWGASDFFGGDASRHDTPVFAVVAITELLGALAMAPVLVARGIPPPDSPRLLFAALAGVAVTCELGLIYRAISRGNAFITAPTGALGAAAAVGVGLIAGDPFSVTVAAGLLLALLGGGVIAWSSSETRRPGGSSWRTAATCAAAGAAVALTLTTLHAAGQLDPYWATAIEHVSTSVSAGIAAFAGDRRSLRRRLPGRTSMPELGLVALAGTGGDLAYASASHSGALSIISAIASLYPVATIALGRLLHGQRATRVELAGIVIALTGAVLLGTASH
jgi:drug/metabolite transporter (DMT)-like permease